MNIHEHIHKEQTTLPTGSAGESIQIRKEYVNYKLNYMKIKKELQIIILGEISQI
jgi:hypothetical protein